MPPKLPTSLIQPAALQPANLTSGTHAPAGFVASMFAGNQGPQGIPITPGTNPQQVATAYGGSQYGLGQTQQYLQALQGSNGIGNLSNVYSRMGATADQLGQEANGQGPIANAIAGVTGQNVANTAALMAGSRGASHDPGLFARGIARQGAATQQQVAPMMANAQLGAQGQLMQQQQAMAGVAGNQVGAYGNAVTGANQAYQSELNSLLSALNNYNSSNVGMQSSINAANAGITQAQLGQQGSLFGGLLNGIGAGLTAALLNQGGIVRHYEQGGVVEPARQPDRSLDSETPDVQYVNGMPHYQGKRLDHPLQYQNMKTDEQNRRAPSSYADGGMVGKDGEPASFLGRFVRGMATPMVGIARPLTATASAAPASPSPLFQGAASFGKGVASLLGPREVEMDADGGITPGEAEVSGDSPKNDTVPALLSPGELVIKRSAMQSPEKMAAFIKATTGFHLVPAGRQA